MKGKREDLEKPGARLLRNDSDNSNAVSDFIQTPMQCRSWGGVWAYWQVNNDPITDGCLSGDACQGLS